MGQVHSAGSGVPGIQAFVSGYNSSSSTIEIGSMVVWDITDADAKGFNLPATASGGLMAGILTEAVAAGQDTDKIQRLGVVDALVDGDSQDVTVGDSLKPVDGSPNLLQDAAGAMSSALQGITALEANTGVAALKSVFINLP